MSLLVNHLWQSTLFAGLVTLVALALRHNQAKTRYGLWLAASVKFLVPFSLLVSLGTQVEVPVSTPVMPALAVEQLTSSFAPAPAWQTTMPQSQSAPWGLILAAVWGAGALILLTCWFGRWLVIRRALRGAVSLPMNAPIPVLASQSIIEPGVFGIFRPVLLLPQGITDNLSNEELEAILAHELTHVCRRDNLTAALHMVVETLFWFHPLVWWIGSKLVEERERACDEAVLEAGREPQVYAQGILNVCKFYIESPLPCASGVSGADLRKRIEEIMTRRGALRLTFARTCLLALAAIAALSLPLAIGILRAQTLPPPPKYKFEVATIRPNNSASGNSRIMPGPQGGLRTENVHALGLIGFAYDLREFQMTGGPGWIRTDHWDIAATPDMPEDAPGPNMPRDKMESMFNRQRQRMQALLMERFGLVLRVETKEMPIYALTLAKGGHKLTPNPEGKGGPNIRTGRNQFTAIGADMGMVIRGLSNIVGRTVVDETGLKGIFDMKMEWTPDNQAADGTAGPSVFAAIQEQMGLKLESKKGPAPVFVIEKIEKPTEN
jgi:bla regulator protein BlaR1